jgi:hypothetical protein
MLATDKYQSKLSTLTLKNSLKSSTRQVKNKFCTSKVQNGDRIDLTEHCHQISDPLIIDQWGIVWWKSPESVPLMNMVMLVGEFLFPVGCMWEQAGDPWIEWKR